MGFVVPPSPEVRRQVAAVNLRRRNLYIELGGRRNVNAAVVGIATGCQLMRQLSPGEAYQLSDGVWLENDKRIDVPTLKRLLDDMGWRGWLVLQRSRDASKARDVKYNFGGNAQYLKSIFEQHSA